MLQPPADRTPPKNINDQPRLADSGGKRGREMQKPLSILNQSLGKRVLVELKGNREYRGVLDGYDPHMNLVLKNAEELVNRQLKQVLELAIVRGDNVIYISPP